MTTRTLTFIAVAAGIAFAWIALAPRVAPPPQAVAQAGLTVRTPAAAPLAPAPSAEPAAVMAAPAPAAAPVARAHVRRPVPPPPAVPATKADEDAPPPVEVASVEATPLGAPAEPGAIQGTLADASGQPLAGVAVFAVAAEGDDFVEDVTDDAGRWLLVSLRPGRYAVFAGIGSPVAARLGARGVDVAPSAVTALALHERPAGATVRVRAVDGAGRVASAQALLVPASSGAPAALPAVLASEAILLPGASRTVVEAVPPGRWTVVMLSGARTVSAPAVVDVAGRDVEVEVRVAGPELSAL
ncbi:MAG: hypothetical protein QM704_01830 [Anaeromyxobacteraceae bacterium]